MRQFRFVHVGVAALMGAATVSAVGLVQTAGAAGSGTASVLVPITPCRLIDTRAGGDNVGARAEPIGSGEAATFQVTGTNGNCTIPASATGIATNATAVNSTSSSYVTIYPADASPRPTASNLNFVAGAAPTPNQVTTGLSATGAIGIFNLVGNVDIIVDIVGYYQASPGGGAQGPQGPQGVQGPAGTNGAPGSRCPAGGCTLVAAGYLGAYTNAGFAPDLNSCVFTTINGYVHVPLELPIGAKISAISAQYFDNASGAANALEFELFVVAHPGSGLGKLNPTAGSNASTDNGESVDLVFTSTPPPVSAAAVPHLRVYVPANTSVRYCGATVTYDF